MYGTSRVLEIVYKRGFYPVIESIVRIAAPWQICRVLSQPRAFPPFHCAKTERLPIAYIQDTVALVEEPCELGSWEQSFRNTGKRTASATADLAGGNQESQASIARTDIRAIPHTETGISQREESVPLARVSGTPHKEERGGKPTQRPSLGAEPSQEALYKSEYFVACRVSAGHRSSLSRFGRGE
jgi:hypothetical protein